ncbi:MAG: sugar ABC transporter ATP-binding protein [Hyphomicrobiales bacterium]|nr:sugar ABC transporter ATP-binding protein [Hyphomicrobiales bacterium]MCP5001930.1 sugar ABC transporter ATP-binding protein [Hyphomicrobiales bacterium]
MSSQDINEGAHPRDAHPLLQACNISKQFPGVKALDGVDFDLRAGEVHILFGENGAGKSTLISMIAGANTPTEGEFKFNGAPVQLNSVHEARTLGISAVFQEFSLIPQMSVEENLFLGAETTSSGILQKGALRRRAAEILDDLDFQLPVNVPVDRLTRAEQQMVEIAKAFRSELSVLILDEPTASLTQHETEQLFRLIARLKADGVGIIYITHRMSEIRRIGDRITILRDGHYIDTVDAETTSEDELVRLMTGRVVGQIFPTIKFDPQQTLLDVHDLKTTDNGVRGASLTVRRGEIVGLAGLVGSGKSKFAQACFGARAISSGSVTFKDDDVTGLSTRKMLDRRFLYLPSDRKNDGLMMMRPVRENISLTSLVSQPVSNGLFLNATGESRMAQSLAERLHLAPMRIERTIEHFSGGNQQKAMLARSLTREFDLIAFDEPTVGVDVGTRAAIYSFIAELCEAGAAILLISSDLPEILNLSNRAYVFYRGQVQAELLGEEITEENVLKHFFEREAA